MAAFEKRLNWGGFEECWIGLAADTKPANAGAGAVAYETDTGTWYVLNLALSWVAFNSAGSAGGTAGNNVVVGNVASGATDSGNPVKVGGKYNATRPTLTDGQRGDAQVDSRGATFVTLSATSGTGNPHGGSNADGASVAATDRLQTSALGYAYNGATLDRLRSNVESTLLASAARTATANSADQTNYNGKGVIVVINVTVEGAATLTLTIQGKDSISGNYYDIITGIVVYTAATDAPTITRAIHLHPGVITADFIGIAATVNGSSAKAVTLPRTWRATVTPADATTTTYSLSVVNL